MKINVLTTFHVDPIKTVPSRVDRRMSTRRMDDEHHTIPKAHPEHAQVS